MRVPACILITLAASTANAGPKTTPTKTWDQVYGSRAGSENLTGNDAAFLFHCPHVAEVANGMVAFKIRLDDSPAKRLHSNEDVDVQLNAMRRAPGAAAMVTLAVGKDGVLDQTVPLSAENRAFVTQRADLAKTSSAITTGHAATYEGSRKLGGLHVTAHFTSSSAGRYLDLAVTGVPSDKGDESGQCITRMQGLDYKEPPATHQARDAGEWCTVDASCMSGVCDVSSRPGICR